MFDFNTDLDNAFIKPISKGYKAVVPKPVDQGVTIFQSTSMMLTRRSTISSN